MDEQERTLWNSERWIVERLIDAVESGDSDAKVKFGQRLLDGIDKQE